MVDLAKVEKDICEHLPSGTSRARVENFLDQRGIQHSFVERSRFGPEHSPEEFAMIRDSSRHGWYNGNIQIVFEFDSQENLASYSVKEIFTGP